MGDTKNTENTNELIKQMGIELDKLKGDYSNTHELDEFYRLYKRFINEQNTKIDWEKIRHPEDKLIDYTDLDEPADARTIFDKLAILKLNGGLGTTMGCTGPKSMIEVKNGMTFMDATIKQLNGLEKEYGIKVPLVLMNSFSTEDETKRIVGSHQHIKMFNQPKFPRIHAGTLMPIEKERYSPSGHGGMFSSIVQSGIVDELIKEGKEYLFISNIDNLAATADPKILNHILTNKIEYAMEVTKKTAADVKGGTLIEYEGTLKLLEIAQVPEEHKKDFKSIKKFKIFNTNSVWISLQAIKRVVADGLDLDIIKNPKTACGQPVIQLETAIGSAIKYFKTNCGIVVPRSRFVPVKTCTDLFTLQSNLFEESNGNIKPNKERVSSDLPTVKLVGENFQHITEYREAIRGTVNIVDLETLIVVGNVHFGKNVTLRGIVVIIAPHWSAFDVPDDSVLENSVLVDNDAQVNL